MVGDIFGDVVEMVGGDVVGMLVVPLGVVVIKKLQSLREFHPAQSR